MEYEKIDSAVFDGWKFDIGALLAESYADRTIVFFNVAEVMRTYAEGLRMAFEMGQRCREMAERQEDTMPEEIMEPVTVIEGYLGVYDRYAYGVYTDGRQFERSKQYWDANSVKSQEFGDYDSALEFAKAGVAAIQGVEANGLPDMRYPQNWRERVWIGGSFNGHE